MPPAAPLRPPVAVALGEIHQQIKKIRPCTHLRFCSPTLATSVSSNRTTLQHTQEHSYRCYLPVLTGFRSLALRRIRPSTPLFVVRAGEARTSRWEFDPAIADCGYRAPLSPHLARPQNLPSKPDRLRAATACGRRPLAASFACDKKMVEQMGIEPTTSRLRTWRSPN